MNNHRIPGVGQILAKKASRVQVEVGTGLRNVAKRGNMWQFTSWRIELLWVFVRLVRFFKKYAMPQCQLNEFIK